MTEHLINVSWKLELNMFASSRNVQVMKTTLLELWEGKRHLSSVPGTVGETAKVFYFFLVK